MRHLVTQYTPSGQDKTLHKIHKITLCFAHFNINFEALHPFAAGQDIIVKSS